MTYTVVWVPAAQNRLATLWMQAPDRQAVRNAADQIDLLLRTDPERRGTPVRGNGVLVQPPLVIVYHIHPDDRLVEVLGVARVKP